MPLVNLSTGVVNYSEHGNGVPIILLHANPGDSRDYEAVTPALSKSYRVLAIDWPGYGQSTLSQQPESVEILFFYQILREFLARLELQPAFFIGNSLGGNIAARLAADSPTLVRGLVLVSPGGFTTPNFISRSFCKFQASQFALSPHRFASLYLKKRTTTTLAMLERTATVQATASCMALNHAIWRSFATPDNDLRSIAPSIKVPTLLLFGKHDPVIPASKDGKVASQCIPSAKFVALPCGHASFAEVPELFLREVQPFLVASQN
jgi:pimeloyl-ACP methyl ester carboxylesterase